MLIRTRAGDSFDTRVAMQSANIDIRSNPAWVPRYPRCDKAGDLFTGRILFRAPKELIYIRFGVLGFFFRIRIVYVTEIVANMTLVRISSNVS